MAIIVLTGGGTAGHCIPNVALIPYLKEKFDEIHYIGSKTGIEKNIIKEQTDLPYYEVSCAKLNRKFNLDNLKIPFKLLNGIFQAKKILKKISPDIIFSKGGYVAIPTILAAKSLKIPIISHESDYTIGLANKLSCKYSEKLLTSFMETAQNIKNAEFVGPPIRKDFFNTSKKEALKYFNISGEKPVILITGGSIGAQAINNTLRDALKELLPHYDILHICGKGNLIKKTLPGYIQIEFLKNMEKAYAACDICVSRAGSNTLFELISLKIPSILIPLPQNISRGDQIFNAQYFHKKGLVYVLFQNNLTTDSLIFAINSVYTNRYNIKQHFEKYPIESSCKKIVSILSEYIE